MSIVKDSLTTTPLTDTVLNMPKYTSRAAALKSAKNMTALLGPGFKPKVFKDAAWSSDDIYTVASQNGMLTVYESGAHSVARYYAVLGPDAQSLEAFEQSPCPEDCHDPRDAAVLCMKQALRTVGYLQEVVGSVKLDDAMLLRCAEVKTHKAPRATKKVRRR